jgi:hypothetical protein
MDLMNVTLRIKVDPFFKLKSPYIDILHNKI